MDAYEEMMLRHGEQRYRGGPKRGLKRMEAYNSPRKDPVAGATTRYTYSPTSTSKAYSRAVADAEKMRAVVAQQRAAAGLPASRPAVLGMNAFDRFMADAGTPPVYTESPDRFNTMVPVERRTWRGAAKAAARPGAPSTLTDIPIQDFPNGYRPTQFLDDVGRQMVAEDPLAVRERMMSRVPVSQKPQMLRSLMELFKGTGRAALYGMPGMIVQDRMMQGPLGGSVFDAIGAATGNLSPEDVVRLQQQWQAANEI